MIFPTQSPPVSRNTATFNRRSQNSGVRAADSRSTQVCSNHCLNDYYCFFGLAEKGCDAANLPYITCRT